MLTADTRSPSPGRIAPRHVQGLIFDMGDVLYDATVWRRWLCRLLNHMDVGGNYRSLFAIWDSMLVRAHRGEAEYQPLFREFLVSLGLRPGQIDEITAASDARRRMLEEQTRAYTGVAATLGKLQAAGLRLAVLSDSESTADKLAARLTRLGLGGYFEAVVSSFDLRRTKPDPHCYQAALAAIHSTADNCAFVGHDEDELCGAAAVGLRTFAFNHEPNVTADAYLDRFDGLLDLVAPPAPRARIPLSSQPGVN